MKKVLEYLEFHKDDPIPEDTPERKKAPKDPTISHPWDAQFIGDLGSPEKEEFVQDLVLAANFLDIPPLIDLGKMY
jgi:hypothetical protein